VNTASSVLKLGLVNVMGNIFKESRWIFFFSHSYRASWYYRSFIYSPTDALVSCLKKQY